MSVLECHIQKLNLRGNLKVFPFEQVQAVLLVLGGYEVPPGLVNMAVPTANDEKVSTHYKMSAVRMCDYFHVLLKLCLLCAEYNRDC